MNIDKLLKEIYDIEGTLDNLQDYLIELCNDRKVPRDNDCEEFDIDDDF